MILCLFPETPMNTPAFFVGAWLVGQQSDHFVYQYSIEFWNSAEKAVIVSRDIYRTHTATDPGYEAVIEDILSIMRSDAAKIGEYSFARDSLDAALFRVALAAHERQSAGQNK